MTLEEINVYMQPERTINGVEVWHNRLKVKAGRSNLQLYLLIDLLKQEAQNVITCQLVSQIRYYRIYKKCNGSVQKSLIDEWNRFCSSTIKIKELHNICSDTKSHFQTFMAMIVVELLRF